jgi:adenosylcobinamide amidohydrolase
MSSKERANENGERPTRKRIGTMNVVLVIVGILLIAFTVKMIVVFEETGAIPDTLCTCVFAACGSECGVMGWIKTTKEKNKEREWQVEDRQEEKKSEESEETENE